MSGSLGSLGWRVRVLAASMVNCAVCVAIRPVGAVSCAIEGVKRDVVFCIT